MSQPTKTPLQWIDAIWMSGARWNEVHLARVIYYIYYYYYYYECISFSNNIRLMQLQNTHRLLTGTEKRMQLIT